MRTWTIVQNHLGVHSFYADETTCMMGDHKTLASAIVSIPMGGNRTDLITEAIVVAHRVGTSLLQIADAIDAGLRAADLEEAQDAENNEGVDPQDPS